MVPTIISLSKQNHPRNLPENVIWILSHRIGVYQPGSPKKVRCKPPTSQWQIAHAGPWSSEFSLWSPETPEAPGRCGQMDDKTPLGRGSPQTKTMSKPSFIANTLQLSHVWGRQYFQCWGHLYVLFEYVNVRNRTTLLTPGKKWSESMRISRFFYFYNSSAKLVGKLSFDPTTTILYLGPILAHRKRYIDTYIHIYICIFILLGEMLNV